MKPNIFNYLDYRQYFFDMIVYSNRELPEFSFRAVAKCLGSRSKVFLRKIMDKKIDVTMSNVRALAKYFKLTEKEKEYFQSIVAFEQASKLKEKDRFLQKLLELRQYPAITTIGEDQYNYFSSWYMPVVRELVTSPCYNDDPQWIADRIIPAVSLEEINNALKLLVSLKLISRDGKKGKWKLTNRVISSTPEVLSRAAIKYHADAIDLGRDAIGRFESNKRDIRSVTLKLSKTGFIAMKKRLEGFWRELLAASDTQPDADQVFTINMQLFPASTPEKEPNQ
jgi:uncharacterized protein (TIGR02147 family)